MLTKDFVFLLCFESRQYESKVKVGNYHEHSTWYGLFSIYDYFKTSHGKPAHRKYLNSRLHYCVYNKTYF